ncbi:hypothetical protein VDT1_1554 [Vibrio sp. 16]|nr:hypothetical protein VDT1_1554 [Vibrio sp. 16]
MKFVSILFAAILAISPVLSHASQNAGHVFGAGIDCTFSDGSVKHLPRELCKAYGGESN